MLFDLRQGRTTKITLGTFNRSSDQRWTNQYKLKPRDPARGKSRLELITLNCLNDVHWSIACKPTSTQTDRTIDLTQLAFACPQTNLV